MAINRKLIFLGLVLLFTGHKIFSAQEFTSSVLVNPIQYNLLRTMASYTPGPAFLPL